MQVFFNMQTKILWNTTAKSHPSQDLQPFASKLIYDIHCQKLDFY